MRAPRARPRPLIVLRCTTYFEKPEQGAWHFLCADAVRRGGGGLFFTVCMGHKPQFSCLQFMANTDRRVVPVPHAGALGADERRVRQPFDSGELKEFRPVRPLSVRE